MRRLAAVLAAALVTAASAACSGDDDAAGSDAAAGASSTTTSIVFTGDPASPFCELLREVDLEGFVDEEAATPADVEAAFTAVLEALAVVAEQAPSELEEDTALVLAGMAALDDALRSAGYSYDALAADPVRAVEVSEAANDPAFAVASARIEAYERQVCQP